MLKGNCHECGESVEFEDYLANDSATCPHCGQLTLLEAGKVEPAKEFLHVELNSGKEIKIADVMLYGAEHIRTVNAKRQRIQQLSGGVSTGLSPWGSLGWVLAASAAVSVVEGVLSAGSDAAANQIIRELPADYAAIELSATYCPIAIIGGRNHPNPAAWLARKRQRDYIHDGSPFLKYQDENGQVAQLRIDSIIHYSVPAAA